MATIRSAWEPDATSPFASATNAQLVNLWKISKLMMNGKVRRVKLVALANCILGA